MKTLKNQILESLLLEARPKKVLNSLLCDIFYTCIDAIDRQAFSSDKVLDIKNSEYLNSKWAVSTPDIINELKDESSKIYDAAQKFFPVVVNFHEVFKKHIAANRVQFIVSKGSGQKNLLYNETFYAAVRWIYVYGVKKPIDWEKSELADECPAALNVFLSDKTYLDAANEFFAGLVELFKVAKK